VATKYDQITTTIKREFLAAIIAGTKKIEYRQIKPFWTEHLSRVGRPFELRVLNGMLPPVPEVTVLIDRVTTNRREQIYELHIRKFLRFKHWNKRRQVPTK
jgi:hypothetical protein